MDAIAFAQNAIATALAAEPAAAATAFSGSAVRKTAMVAVGPSPDTVDARGSGAAEETQKSGEDQTERTLTRKTPDAKASKDELPAKDSTPPAADKTDQGTTNWPQPYTEKKGDDSPKHEGKKVAKQK